MILNNDKRLTRYNVSKLIGKAWGKAASVSNGIAALKSCGIYLISDTLREQDLVDDEQGNVHELGKGCLGLQSI